MRMTQLALVALGAALISASSAQAQTQVPTDTRALDGQSLTTQTSGTQDLFQLVWGPRAASEWVAEHNALLGPALPVVLAPVLPKPVSLIMNDHDQFVPASLSVSRGTSVTWSNEDTDPHTVTGDPSKSFPGVKVIEPAGALPFDSGLVPQGKSFTYTFDTAGHYIYICTVHAGSGMVATIDVV